jgi:hypothetical protein
MCTCYIADNCSPDPVDEIATQIFEYHNFASFTIYRRAVNIGGVGNILHCFEAPKTPWIWVLGDDDIPLPNAVESILQAIRQHPDAIALGYAFTQGLSAPNSDDFEIISEPSKFFTSTASYQVSLISSCVYNRHYVHSVLTDGYMFGSSCFPHLAFITRLLDKSSTTFMVYTKCSIVQYVGDGHSDLNANPIVANFRYLSRMLLPSKECGSLMQGPLAATFVGTVIGRYCAPRLHHIAFATALRQMDDAQCVLRRARRAAGEALEFDNAVQLVPVGGIFLLVKLLVGIVLGFFLGPILRSWYFWLKQHYPARVLFLKNWGEYCGYP